MIEKHWNLGVAIFETACDTPHASTLIPVPSLIYHNVSWCLTNLNDFIDLNSTNEVRVWVNHARHAAAQTRLLLSRGYLPGDSAIELACHDVSWFFHVSSGFALQATDTCPKMSQIQVLPIVLPLFQKLLNSFVVLCGFVYHIYNHPATHCHILPSASAAAVTMPLYMA